MNDLRCTIAYCDNKLNDLPNIITGLCKEHRSLLYHIDPSDILLGICWNCMAFTLIQKKDNDNIVKDTYLFTKTCKSCSPTLTRETGFEWMTFKKTPLELSDVRISDIIRNF